jgi:hypothetical protein
VPYSDVTTLLTRAAAELFRHAKLQGLAAVVPLPPKGKSQVVEVSVRVSKDSLLGKRHAKDIATEFLAVVHDVTKSKLFDPRARKPAVKITVKVGNAVTLQQGGPRARPFMGGDSGGHKSHTTGTYTCSLLVGGQTGYVLGAGHVLAPERRNGAHVGDEVVQPAHATGPDDVVGKLVRWIADPVSGSGVQLVADAAIARTRRDDLVADRIRLRGGAPRPLKSRRRPVVGDVVTVAGTMTNHVTTIESLEASFTVGGTTLVYVSQLSYEAATVGGDSGAPLVTDEGVVLGLHVAGDGVNGYGNNIELALRELGRPEPKQGWTGAEIEVPPISPGPPNGDKNGGHDDDDLDHEENAMNASCVTINVYCGGSAAGGGKRKLTGKVQQQTLQRFERFRLFDGRSGPSKGSGDDLTGLSYQPQKTTAPPDNGGSVPLGNVDDQSGVEHVNEGMNLGDREPDRVVLTYQHGTQAKTATLQVSPMHVADGYFLARVTATVIGPNEVRADYVLGNADPAKLPECIYDEQLAMS